MSDIHPLSSILSNAERVRVERLAAESGDPVDLVATRLGFCSETQLLKAFSDHAGVPIAKAADFPNLGLFREELNPDFLRHARILPLSEEGDAICVAMANPLDEDAIGALTFALRRPIRVSVATGSEIEQGWSRLYGPETLQEEEADKHYDLTEDVQKLRDMASEAPVIRFVNQLIASAVELNASDIHLEPFTNRLRVRFRLDGLLKQMDDAPDGFAAAIISRLKIMARLNIAERRLAQDGRFRIALRGLDIDLRVATMPTLHGEAMVLRILDGEAVKLELSSLGFSESNLASWRGLLQLPHGIVLVTGPTGSGKTTTLYAGLNEINTEDRKILSIEDPIELQLEGVNQVQVKNAIGLGFADALRSFFRLDPNVILVGEIRDLETAQTAVQAALTGHLILSTLHTNDAASALTRLLDMGIDDYILSSTLQGVLAQRLVRKLCAHCRAPAPPAAPPVGYEGAVFFRPVGCPSCAGTGFAGRTVIAELIVMTDELRRLAMRRASADEVRQAAIGQGMVTLFTDGMNKAAAGITTPDEVLRACMEN